MFNEEINKLIPNISTIYHNLYEDGIFIKKDPGTIVVKFHKINDERRLYDKDYNVSWFIKNLSGYQFEGTKIYPIDEGFEKKYYHNSVEYFNEKIRELENELNSIDDTGYTSIGIKGNSIFKQKSLIQTKLNILRSAKLHPYFARIDLQDVKNPENGITYYIENYNADEKSPNKNRNYSTDINKWMEKELGIISIDWRSKEAMPYHDQEMFTNEQSDIKLILRRIYNIKMDLLDYIDDLSSEKELIDQVSDERLKKIILNSRLNNIKNIISSIQTYQYRIINNNPEKNMLIEGCAGSGKTMILAHRLSFWAYRLKDSFDIKNVYVISPTKFLSMETYNIDVADTKNANYFSNSDFNLYLINKISNELIIDFKPNSNYISNNNLSDDIVKKLYSNHVIDYFNDLFQSLKYDNDHELVLSFEKYLETQEKSIVSQHLKVKGKVTKKLQNEYNQKYRYLCKELKKLSFIDLKKYSDELDYKYKDQIHENKELKKLKKKLTTAKKDATTSVTQLVKYHSLFSVCQGLSFHEINDILKQFIEQYDEDKINCYNLIDEIEKVTDLTEIQLIKKKLKDVNSQLKRANFITRLSLNREKSALEKSLEDAYQERIETLKKYNIHPNTDNVDEIEQHILDYIHSYDEILKIVNTARVNIDSLIELLDQYKEFKDRDIDQNEDLSSVSKRMSLIKQLLKKNTYLSDASPKKAKVKEIIERIEKLEIPNYLSNIEFLDNYSSYLNDKETLKFDLYKEGHKFDIVVMYAIQFIIEKIKLENQIDVNTHYEFELFMTLYLLNGMEGFSREKGKWLFIDEVQDYSKAELNLYKSLFPQSTFNLFGDMKQSINAKGLSKFHLNLMTKNYDKFSIEENYRNSNEITDYVNATFDLHMKAIGLNGSVRTGNITEFFDSLDDFHNNVAIIAADDYKEKYLKQYKEKYNLNFVDSESVINKEMINVFNPLLVKGLEFDKVCVINEGMSQNERYVSYTRGLTDLFVVEREDSK